MMVVPQLVIFDLGGTTIRDRGEVPAAFSEALVASGWTVDAAAVATWRGASKREVIDRLVADRSPGRPQRARQSLSADIYRRFRDLLTARFHAAADLALPEARRAFERLRRGGIRVSLNSGFDRAIIDLILPATLWPPELIDAVVCGDDVPAGRPAPFMIFRSMELTGVTDIRRVAVVGDTRLDLQAAANAGAAYAIGVLTGAHDRATLEGAPHSHLMASVGAVPDLWLEG